MYKILSVLAFVMLAGIGFAAPAAAQAPSGFQVCAGDDPSCQTAGTVGLLCMPNQQSFNDMSIWRSSSDAMRVNNGQWELWSRGSAAGACPFALVYHGFQSQGWGGLRFCSGSDPSCQGSGQVAYACFLDQDAVSDPSQWQYTGDAIQVSGSQWTMFYASTRQHYNCEAVLVGGVPYGGFGQLRLCQGNDASCQGTNAMPLLCDINGDGFGAPTKSDYTGRDIRVSGGQWQIRYPDGSLFSCSRVIVAVAGGGRPGGIGNPPANTPPSTPNTPPIGQFQPPGSQPQTPPSAQPQAAQVPSGAVIYYDGSQCPAGWTLLGYVQRPASPVSGMVFCRKN